MDVPFGGCVQWAPFCVPKCMFLFVMRPRTMWLIEMWHRRTCYMAASINIAASSQTNTGNCHVWLTECIIIKYNIPMYIFLFSISECECLRTMFDFRRRRRLSARTETKRWSMRLVRLVSDLERWPLHRYLRQPPILRRTVIDDFGASDRILPYTERVQLSDAFGYCNLLFCLNFDS